MSGYPDTDEGCKKGTRWCIIKSCPSGELAHTCKKVERGGGGHINNQTNVRNGHQHPRAPSVCCVPLFLSIVARDYLKVHETLVTLSTCIRCASQFEEHPIRPLHKMTVKQELIVLR